ncbi:MAG: radical SAM protein [Endomicrobiales bacterium]
MYFSRYNIFSRIRDSENYFLLNLLTGQADILDPAKAREVEAREYSDVEEYLYKGYLTTREDEEKLYRARYLDFLSGRGRSETQIFFVPRYSCNFSCFYCYQEGYGKEEAPAPFTEVADAFFRYIDGEFAGKPKYVTVFGGEPLLSTAQARAEMEYLVSEADKRGLSLAMVTNGYTLREYVPLLQKGDIREVQVTLDGPKEIHDKRRTLKGGGKTFDAVAGGIDAALAGGLPINLRIVVDRDNIDSLPELARFADKKGWTKNPLFKTQIGRNYELHKCQSSRDRLFDRVGLYEKIYALMKQHPELGELHKPAFSVAGFLAENGKLPDPLFDSCPGCKTEWVFDHTGAIYPCTATVGKKDEAVGSFYPAVTRKQDIIGLWEERDVTAIEACRDCSVQLACGGGCAAVAKNRTGKLHAPDCRPVKELLEMGMAVYFKGEAQ